VDEVLMRIPLLIFGLALVAPSIPLDACGDKLLMLGRGMRFQSKHTPHAAVVLLYVPSATRGARALTDPNIESALKEAGHQLRAVTTPQELQDALSSSQYDVVLTDVSGAAALQDTLSTIKGSPVVLPVVYLLAPDGQPQVKQQAKDETARATKAFSLIVQVPGRPGHYCAAVDKAMELKLKRDRSSTTSP
jgi:CheY-like chemotaxis protein